MIKTISGKVADRRDSNSCTALVLGRAGAGKTTLMQNEINYVRENYPEDDIVVASAYADDYPEKCGLEEMRVLCENSTYHINPMDFVIDKWFIELGVDNCTEAVNEKADFVTGLFKTICEKELSISETNLVIKAVKNVCRKFSDYLFSRKEKGVSDWWYDLENNPTLYDLAIEIEELQFPEHDLAIGEIQNILSTYTGENSKAVFKKIKEIVGKTATEKFFSANLSKCVKLIKENKEIFNKRTNIPMDKPRLITVLSDVNSSVKLFNLFPAIFCEYIQTINKIRRNASVCKRNWIYLESELANAVFLDEKIDNECVIPLFKRGRMAGNKIMLSLTYIGNTSLSKYAYIFTNLDSFYLLQAHNNTITQLSACYPDLCKAYKIENISNLPVGCGVVCRNSLTEICKFEFDDIK